MAALAKDESVAIRPLIPHSALLARAPDPRCSSGIERGQPKHAPAERREEVISRQMMRWVRIEDVGDTEFLIDEQTDKFRFAT
jgi:hypothetical protein